MSVHQTISVADEGYDNQGTVNTVAPGAVEKLDLTLEEIISTGAEERREGGSTGALARKYRKSGVHRHDPRGQSGRRTGRPETLVNLKFSGSINKRRVPLTVSGGRSQVRTNITKQSVLAAKAFQQLPAIAAHAVQTAEATSMRGPYQPPMYAAYPSWSPGHVPHVFVPAVTPQGKAYSLRLGGSRYGLQQAGRLSAQDAALLSTEIIQQENGDITIRFKQTDLVLVKAGTGDLILNSDGYRTFSTKAVLNQALQPVGLWVDDSTATPRSENPSSAAASDQDQRNLNQPEWVVSDRRSYLATFVDGMVIRQAGALSKAQMVARGSVIAQYLRQRKFDAEKTSRSLNGKGPNRRRQHRAGDGEGVPSPGTKTEYQHQALESINEDGMAE